MSLYIDLYITGNDLTLDSGGEPLLIDDRESIAQDIKHLIRESGLMVTIIGQRSRLIIADAIQRLVLLIEDDERLVPGTIEITEPSFELYYVQADTVEFGPLGFSVFNRFIKSVDEAVPPTPPETFYLTDDFGTVLTDDSGNKLTWHSDAMPPETFFLTDDFGNLLTDDSGNQLTWQ